jgi:hypothetical protein
MATPESRHMPRLKVLTSLCFHRIKLRSEGEDQAITINLSIRGLYFATTLVISVGEAIEILTEMPERVTGAKATIQRFTGRVVHVESETCLKAIREQACNRFTTSVRQLPVCN